MKEKIPRKDDCVVTMLSGNTAVPSTDTTSLGVPNIQLASYFVNDRSAVECLVMGPKKYTHFTCPLASFCQSPIYDVEYTCPLIYE